MVPFRTYDSFVLDFPKPAHDAKIRREQRVRSQIRLSTESVSPMRVGSEPRVIDIVE